MIFYYITASDEYTLHTYVYGTFFETKQAEDENMSETEEIL